ncbi:MAG: hypothetical protein KIT54_02555 [Phycisphaeraceae bacterium]|nr:hypothetical protein [Phycisphaeraceae bacterium]
MTRETRRRRLTLARLALIAWLGFVVAASVLPLFMVIRIYEPGMTAFWVVGGGGMRRVAFPSPFTETHTVFEWSPSAAIGTEFAFAYSDPGGGAVRRPPHFVSAPPWATLLVPTLLVLAIHAHRRKRRALPPGRTPCPACQYDATGLAVCPECGADVGAGRAG